MNYGAKIWFALALTFVPAINAYFYCGTLDTYPYFICLSLGAAISGAIAFRRRHDNDVPIIKTDVAATVESHEAKVYLLYLGPPLWLTAIALIANQYCDRSPRVDYPVHLLKFTVYRKGPSAVLVESWRDPGSTQGMRYDQRRMSAISTGTQPGQPLVVTVRAGALGWAWVENLRLAE